MGRDLGPGSIRSAVSEPLAGLGSGPIFDRRLEESFGHLRCEVAGLSLGEQALEGEAGGVLLGLLLGGSFRFGEGGGAPPLIFNSNFDAEALLMVWAALVGEDVVGLAGSGGLEMFL